MSKFFKILVLFDTAGTPPNDQDFTKAFKTPPWKTEAQVTGELKRMGHDVLTLGVYEETDLLYRTLKRASPDIVFNLMEHFGGKGRLDSAVTGLMEMMGIPYTGCSAEGLILARDKPTAKRIVRATGIKTPEFVVFYSEKSRKRRAWGTPPLEKGGRGDFKFLFNPPYIVKPADDDGSVGISRASLVTNERALKARVRFIHKRFKCSAIVEEFIPGRELYVSVIGGGSHEVFPAREMAFGRKAGGICGFATYRMKWNDKYREHLGVKNRFAKLAPRVERELSETAVEICRALRLDGYARIDFRLSPENKIYFIEANPNPYLARDEDFALSARKSGLNYGELLERIIRVGFKIRRNL